MYRINLTMMSSDVRNLQVVSVTEEYPTEREVLEVAGMYKSRGGALSLVVSNGPNVLMMWTRPMDGLITQEECVHGLPTGTGCPECREIVRALRPLGRL